MIRRVAVRGIAVLNGKLLCARLKPYSHPDQGSYWCVPGGGVDPGEALIPALMREMIEETAIEPKVGNLLYIQQFKLGDKEQLELFFHILNPENYREINLANASHASVEIEEISFIDPAEYHILPKFLTTEPITDISPDQPTKLFNYL